MDLSPVKRYKYTNWAGTFNCVAGLFWEPSSKDELYQILKFVREGNLKVTFVGNQSSPSDLPCNTAALVSLRKFNKIIKIDKTTKTAVVEGGVVFSDLQEELAKEGLAFPTLPSISFMTVAGAISTGTHGNGVKHGNLSSLVIAVELMLASGEVITIKKDDELLDAVRVSLGLLGAILSVEFQLDDAFNVCETTTVMCFSEVIKEIRDIPKRSEYSKLTYFPHSDAFVVYDMNKTDEKTTEMSHAVTFYDVFVKKLVGKYLFGGLLVSSYYIPPVTPYVCKFIFNAVHNKESRRVDRSDKIFNFDCLFSQYVTEYSFRIEFTRAVLEEMRSFIRSENLKINLPIEIRFVKSDNTYLSQTYGYDCAIINIGSYCPLHYRASKEKFWLLFEDLMRKVEGRPHWAKSHRHGPDELSKLYPKFGEFLKVKKLLDPDEIICNDYYLRHFKGVTNAKYLSFYP